MRTDVQILKSLIKNVSPKARGIFLTGIGTLVSCILQELSVQKNKVQLINQTPMSEEMRTKKKRI